MAFPSNQFYNQDPKSNQEIKEFVKERFGVTFHMFAKVNVNGPNTHPLFAYLRCNSELYDRSSGKAKQIPWNFGKFLLDEEGKVVKYFNPTVSPLDMEEEIVELLEKK